MTFFEDLTKRAEIAADLAVDKAKDLAEVGKRKLDIAAEEREIQKLYERIGRTVYHLEKENPDSMYASECNQITKRLQNIAELKMNNEDE